MDEQTVEQCLSKLRDAFALLLADRTSQLSFDDLYSTVYRLTIGRRGAEVHRAVRDAIATQARTTRSLETYWVGVRAIADVCMFFERNHPSLPSAREVASTALRKREALDHVRRIAPRVGRLRMFWLRLYAHVLYKPHGRGEAMAKASFIKTARACTWHA